MTSHNKDCSNSSYNLSVSIFYANVRSLKNKLDYLKFFLNTNTYDIIAFSETWLNKYIDDYSIITDKKYQIFCSDRNNARKGGGIAFLINSELLPRHLDSKEICGMNFLTVSINNFLIILVYIPPDRSNDKKSISALTNYLINWTAGYEHFAVLGDFNLSSIFGNNSIGGSEAAKFFQNFCTDLNLVQTVPFPTRNGNFLDILLTNKPELNINFHHLPPFSTSDHTSFSCNFKILPLTCSHSISVTPNYFKADFSALNVYFSQVNWVGLFKHCNDINLIYSKFLETINNAIKKFVPLKKKKSGMRVYPHYINNLHNRVIRLSKLIHRSDTKSQYLRLSNILKLRLKRLHRKNELLIYKKSKVHFLKHIASKTKFNSKSPHW